MLLLDVVFVGAVELLVVVLLEVVVEVEVEDVDELLLEVLELRQSLTAS